MFIKIISNYLDAKEENTLYLTYSHYDDYGYCTTYNVYVCSGKIIPKSLGIVKIGCKDLDLKAKKGQSHNGFASYSVNEILKIDPISGLNDEFYSLGQSIDYYRDINDCFGEKSKEVYKAMKDIAFNFEHFQHLYSEHEPCLINSLMRDLHYPNVEQFHRISVGDALLTKYDFMFSYGESSMEFQVDPNSTPPSNIHVLIGRNGVGKTRLLYNLACKFLKEMSIEVDAKKSTKYSVDDCLVLNNNKTSFAGIVGVSFSVFDDGFSSIYPLYSSAESIDKEEIDDFNKKYKYIGLMKRTELKDGKPDLKIKNNKEENSNYIIKTIVDFTNEYIEILKSISKVDYKKRLYQEICQDLETDVMFSEHNYSSIIRNFFDNPLETNNVKEYFRKLSSGHMIIVLSLTELCNFIHEKTIVLIDEPEIHLHPPLLSTYIRTLSILLRKRNAVAIIATHSPIVLQEVPKTCVTKVERIGGQMIFNRPNIETFASGTDQLTRDIFGYEIIKTGFYKLLQENLCSNFDKTLDLFENHVGSLGQIMIQGLLQKEGRADNEED